MTTIEALDPQPMPETPSATAHGRPKCGAKNRTGTLCGRSAGWGTDHPGVGRCRSHGGNTPNARRGAARVVAEQTARGILVRMGEPVPIRNAAATLMDVLGRAYQWMIACGLQVETLEAADLTTMDQFGVERCRALVQLYTEALDRTARISSDAARLKLEERLVEINEALAEQVLAVAERALMLAVPAEFHGPFKAAFAVEAQSREVTK